jgi:hypothetical protein
MYKHVLRKVEIPIICLQAATQDDNDDPDNMTYEVSVIFTCITFLL